MLSLIHIFIDRYARKLAENINQSNLIDARVPSILIAGGSNFPVRKDVYKRQGKAGPASQPDASGQPGTVPLFMEGHPLKICEYCIALHMSRI